VVGGAGGGSVGVVVPGAGFAVVVVVVSGAGSVVVVVSGAGSVVVVGSVTWASAGSPDRAAIVSDTADRAAASTITRRARPRRSVVARVSNSATPRPHFEIGSLQYPRRTVPPSHTSADGRNDPGMTAHAAP